MKQALGVWAGQGLGNGVEQGVQGHDGADCRFLPSSADQAGLMKLDKNGRNLGVFLPKPWAIDSENPVHVTGGLNYYESAFKMGCL